MKLRKRALIFAAFILATLAMLPGSLSITNAQDGLTVPDAMPTAEASGYDLVNFLLLGSDTSNPQNSGRTDVLMIVSINRTTGTVSLLSIPRDLWVYIPGWGMQRINTAYPHGENTPGYDGGGRQLIEDTILYNLGIKIDYYARVDFNGFKTIVDSVGGVDVSVDCAIQDWRLREPGLDQTVEDNWVRYTLPIGVQHMDGDLALWYVRSRKSSSDFDRGRRQQDVMRALLRRVRDLGLLNQMTDIWPQVLETVQTDVSLDSMVSLVPLALSVDSSHIASYTFRPNTEVTFWTTPDGASVLLPQRDAIAQLVQQFLLPPTTSQLVREHSSIEIVNATGVTDLGQVASDRLATEGFVPQIVPGLAQYQDYTTIYDYTGQSKGSSLGDLQRVLRVSSDGVVVQPDPTRSFDFQVVLGGSYHSCTYAVLAPVPVDTPTPTPGA
jgi:polyisoprenyl-teichoic acid--peptidoglycan teichoic acid transferase